MFWNFLSSLCCKCQTASDCFCQTAGEQMEKICQIPTEIFDLLCLWCIFRSHYCFLEEDFRSNLSLLRLMGKNPVIFISIQSWCTDEEFFKLSCQNNKQQAKHVLQLTHDSRLTTMKFVNQTKNPFCFVNAKQPLKKPYLLHLNNPVKVAAFGPDVQDS